ncbi:MAG: thiolase family protein, partial [Alphaproteobacteria bacterium]|nr:thiolase family protein [Alphaproteobacteria bacterium]
FAPLASTAEAAAAALSMAGRGPGEVGVAEVHDAFSVCEPMALEAAGICAPGTGAAYAREMLETCSRRINPRGGLLGSGHPPGATGVAQAAEIFLQVCGRAGRRQADSASCGMIHNMSAAGTSSSVIVMEA